jgi:hypothetical protein
MISTISLTLNLDTKIGRVTDTTDYSGLIASLGLYQAKGLGTISFQGNIIESKTTVGDPLIDLALGDTFFEFPLELDVNGEVANGIYEVDYSLRLSNLALTPPIASVNLPSEIEVVMPEILSNFLQVGNTINLAKVGGDQDVTIASINYVDPTESFITFNEVIDDPTYTLWYFDLINLQVQGVYTYSGCVRAEGKTSFSYDCDVAPNGTFGVSNATVLSAGQVVSSLNANISYPSWTASQVGFNPQISNVPLPYTNNVLATGTYTVVMNQIINQVQNDGLIIAYSANATNEFNVSCVGSLCGLNSCIDSLRVAHAAELQRNRISKYQVFVDNVLMYYAEAQTYRACGDADAYRTALANIQSQLDASGCDCGCCDDDVFTFVSVNSSATIESLIQAIQYRLKTGVPDANDDETAGVEIGAIWQNVTTGILYRCTNNTATAATWSIYYDPGSIIVTASGVLSNAQTGGIIIGTNVQANIDSINIALVSNAAELGVIQGDITDINIEIGGLVEGVTGDFVDNTDPNNPVVLNPGASQVTYSATIDGSTITTVNGALEKLRVSESDYNNSLLFYSGSTSVKSTLNNAITGKIALKISDTGAVQVVGNNMYDPTSATPTFVQQLGNNYHLTLPSNEMTSFTAVTVTGTPKGDSIMIKAERISNNVVNVVFYNTTTGNQTSTISPMYMVIEVYR